MAKKNALSREEAAALYEDLRKNFAAFSGDQNPKDFQQKPAAKKYFKPAGVSPKAKVAQAYKKPSSSMAGYSGMQSQEDAIAAAIQRGLGRKQGSSSGIGAKLAVSTLVLAAALKFSISALEYSGAIESQPAFASMASFNAVSSAPRDVQNFTPEQVALLKTLDSRRAEIEDRRKILDKREAEANNRDKEFAIKLAELRDLTQQLKNSREADVKKKAGQLDQLANVYGSMDPREAALLIEQLDDVIAIELLNRMPEKRIGQILALMNKEKALAMTRMLSGK